MPAVDLLVAALAAFMVKATIVVTLAWAVYAASRRWLSAAARHLVLSLAAVMLLALPMLSVVLPSWSIPVALTSPSAVSTLVSAHAIDSVTSAGGDAAVAVESAVASEPAAVAVTRIPWNAVGVAIYLCGVLAMLGHLAAQRWRVHRLGRDADVVTDQQWLSLVAEGAAILGVQRPVRLLRSRTATMPMAFGTRRPAILVPATADTWDADRRRAVVLHELAHVVRLDCLTQWGACAMRAVYWCHPGAWWLVSRIRLEREFACDDLVLAAGAPPQDYARHLLDIAYAFGGGRAPALAVRMARRSQLEGRLRALLDRTRVRQSPSRSARMATTVGAFALLVPLATVGTATTTVSAADEAAGVEALAVDAATEHASIVAGPMPSPAPEPGPHPEPMVHEQASPAADDGTCTWEVRPGDAGNVHLSVRTGRSQSGRTVPLSQLDGLTAAQLSGGGPVKFVVRRDAGTFTFEGAARGNAAGGVCSLALSPTFGAELGKRGISGLTPADQTEMARHDVSLAFVDELRTQKYATPTVADLVKAGRHGVHLAYLRGMGELGYATGTLEPLITLRDHGVTPDYAKALASFGYVKLPIDQLQKARDHGVTPDYIQGMRDAGHGSLTLEQLITTRDHGVTPEFGKALAAAGFAGLSLDQLVRVRDHGVTPDYIKDMKAFGIGSTVEDLVMARDHGVTTDYVRGLDGLGYKKLSLDQLLKMRDHGVTPSFVKDVQGQGYANLSTDDLVALRDHGLTGDRIRRINAKAGSQLSVAALRDAAARGQ